MEIGKWYIEILIYYFWGITLSKTFKICFPSEYKKTLKTLLVEKFIKQLHSYRKLFDDNFYWRKNVLYAKSYHTSLIHIAFFWKIWRHVNCRNCIEDVKILQKKQITDTFLCIRCGGINRGIIGKTFSTRKKGIWSLTWKISMEINGRPSMETLKASFLVAV